MDKIFYNSIFQYERNSMVSERLYQKGVNLPFRMFKNEKVFNQFVIKDLELINEGMMLYHLASRHNDGSNYHLMNPEDEGFKLIELKEYDVFPLLANPNRKLIEIQSFNKNLTDNE